MFDEPQEDPGERSFNPADRAREKTDEFRMHAELAAVFEGHRKFDVQIVSGMGPELAREVQRAVGRLEKTRSPESPLLAGPATGEAAEVLDYFASHELSPNDYHIYRRPGEVMIVRWIQGDQVDTFYERLQAHFDAAMSGYREDEKQANEWKQDANTQAYMAALDAIEVKMADRYLRDVIRKHEIFVLSTQSADEINIAYLANDIMGVSVDEIVGTASAPPEQPTESDLAWFFKLFSLRGIREGIEQMCFFAYLQKVDDSGSDW